MLALGAGCGVAPAGAQTTTCTGFNPPGLTLTNVFVPSGADCTLVSPTTVTGNVLVGRGGSLHIIYAVVHGNISATGAAFIGFDGGTVGGNLILVGSAGGISIGYANITGNLVIAGMTSGSILVEESTVGNNLILNGNTTESSRPFGDVIGGNTIGGNLVCEGNTPPPTAAPLANNTVSGQKVGQCAKL